MSLIFLGYIPGVKRIKIDYANEIIHNMGLGYPKTYVYQFIFDKEGISNTRILQCFVIHELVV